MAIVEVTNNRVVLNMTRNEAEAILASLEYTTEHGLCMGMGEGLDDGQRLVNQMVVNKLHRALFALGKKMGEVQ